VTGLATIHGGGWQNTAGRISLAASKFGVGKKRKMGCSRLFVFVVND